ncbi:MAG: hypothetical protein AMXMBFR84_38470 [Candidatus Hydrogenedentota bacterium]
MTAALIRYGVILGAAALGYVISRFFIGNPNGTSILRNPTSMALLFGVLGYVGVTAYMGGFSSIAWGAEVVPIETEQQLQDLIAKADGKPVLVDFYATWCMPCKMTAPEVQKVAREGHVVAVVDVDKASALAAAYDVQSIPTLLVFKGDQIHKAMGYHSAADLKALIDS